MKLAWLCYIYMDVSGDKCFHPRPVILFTEPDPYRYDKVVPIVYAEIVES